MANVFALDELLSGPQVVRTDDGGMAVEVTIDRPSARCLWARTFAMALRDREGVTSIHFHPWLAGERLSYRNMANLYCVFPPPLKLTHLFLDEARVIVGAGSLRAWLAGGTVAGEFEVDCHGQRSRWVGMVWNAGKTQGVDFYRLREPRISESDWEETLRSIPQTASNG
jgi:hypothetical protein